MDDVLADLSLNPSSHDEEGLLELSIGSDEQLDDQLDQIAGTSTLIDNVEYHQSDIPFVKESLADSLLDQDEDIYRSLLIEEELNARQSVVLSSTIDQNLMPGNISPVLIEQSQDDPLLSPVFSIDELLESELTSLELLVEDKNDSTEIVEVDVHLDPTSAEVISLALDQGIDPLESGEIEADQSWEIINISHDDVSLEKPFWDAFSVDHGIPDIESFSEEKLYLQTKLVSKDDAAFVDIHVFDNRESAVSLTGLNLDVAWNTQNLSLNENHFEQGVVFRNSDAPLFQSLGEIHSSVNDVGTETQTISGLTAASLPIVGSGQPMGKSAISGSPQKTIFASIPVNHLGINQKHGFSLNINEAVQTDGVALNPNDLIAVVDEEKTSVLNIDQSRLKHGEYVVDVMNSSNLLSRYHLNNSVISQQKIDSTVSSYSAYSMPDDQTAQPIDSLASASPPLLIESADVQFLSPGVWKQSVSLRQDQKPWSLSLDGLFADHHQAQQLDVIKTGQLPTWLQFSTTDSSTAGYLIGQPENTDVGNSATQLSFIDPVGQLATLILDFSVENVNDSPLLRRADQPLALIVDSAEANPLHRVAGRLDLSELFQDPDSVYGDHLNFTIAGVKDQAGELLEDLDWLRISHAATDLDAVGLNVDLRPELSITDVNGESRIISIADVSDLDEGSLIEVDIVLSDQRDIEDPGLIAVDFDLHVGESLTLKKDSVTLSSSLPIFQNIDLTDAKENIDFSTLSIQAGALPRFGMGHSVGEQSHVLSSFTLEVKDPNQIHSIGISPGHGNSRDGLLDLSGQSIDCDSISANSLSSRSASFIEVVSSKSLIDGQYLVTIEAKDRAGASIVYDLPIFIGSPPKTDFSIQPLADAMLRQMSSEALSELWKRQINQPKSLSLSQSLALGGLTQFSSLNAASVHSAMDEGRFHISPSVNSDLPLLALYSEGSSLIDAESILQSNADSLLHDAELNIESFQAPVGALEFSLSGDDESAIDVVNIAMTAGGVQLNRLYKSTNDGGLQDFSSEVVVPPQGLTALERADWLHSLTYSIYDYSIDQYEPVSVYSSESGFVGGSPGFTDDVDLSSLDGSAYLIDFNDDGLTDMISLALVDQGYFDLDTKIGVIKDPVIPIFDTDYLVEKSDYVAPYQQLSGSGSSISSTLITSGTVISPAPVVSFVPEGKPFILSDPLGYEVISPPTESVVPEDVSPIAQPIVETLIPSTALLDNQVLNDSSSLSESQHFAALSTLPSKGHLLSSPNIKVSQTASSVNNSNGTSSHISTDRSTSQPLVENDQFQDSLSNHSQVITSQSYENSFMSKFDRFFSSDQLSQISGSFQSVVDDISLHLSDLGSSLVFSLGLISFPQLSQLSLPVLGRIKRRYPMTITQRLHESSLKKSLPIPGIMSALCLSIQAGRLSIQVVPSATSFCDSITSSSFLGELFTASLKPGLFAEECISALQTLTLRNAEPMDWAGWLKRLSAHTYCDTQTTVLNKTLSPLLSDINSLLNVSPSAADLHMAALISGFLLSKGFSFSDLPGYSASKMEK